MVNLVSYMSAHTLLVFFQITFIQPLTGKQAEGSEVK